jgi:hypothetical protein
MLSTLAGLLLLGALGWLARSRPGPALGAALVLYLVLVGVGLAAEARVAKDGVPRVTRGALAVNAGVVACLAWALALGGRTRPASS